MAESAVDILRTHASLDEDIETWMYLTEGLSVFWEFTGSDSGCRSLGVRIDGQRFFVKFSREPRGVAGLKRAAALAARVQDSALPKLCGALEFTGGFALIYPWLNACMIREPEVGRRFRALPRERILAALETIFAVHLKLEAAGYVAVDLYDGCMLYDFELERMFLCDLDEYRLGAFTLDLPRLPGSTRFMPPEQCQRGSRIDGRSTIYVLGRTAAILLGDVAGSPESWRGGPAMQMVVRQAAAVDPAGRYPTVAEFVRCWHTACRSDAMGMTL